MARAWNVAHPDQMREARQKFNTAHPDYQRHYQRLYRWKRLHIQATNEQYEALLAKQSGLCAVCKEIDPQRSLAIDHNHLTGKIRGLLCTPCNRWIVSVVEKYPDLVKAAQKYLEEY